MSDTALREEARQKQEIGYLCSRGHFVFYSDPDAGACGAKKIASLYVEAIETDSRMFEEPYQEADETGFVYYSSTGYSIDDYQGTVDEAVSKLAIRGGTSE